MEGQAAESMDRNIEGNRSNAQIWNNLENGSGIWEILSRSSVPCMKECKGHEEVIELIVSDLEDGSGHSRQEHLVDEGVETTCERRGKTE